MPTTLANCGNFNNGKTKFILPQSLFFQLTPNSTTNLKRFYFKTFGKLLWKYFWQIFAHNHKLTTMLRTIQMILIKLLSIFYLITTISILVVDCAPSKSAVNNSSFLLLNNSNVKSFVHTNIVNKIVNNSFIVNNNVNNNVRIKYVDDRMINDNSKQRYSETKQSIPNTKINDNGDVNQLSSKSLSSSSLLFDIGNGNENRNTDNQTKTLVAVGTWPRPMPTLQPKSTTTSINLDDDDDHYYPKWKSNPTTIATTDNHQITLANITTTTKKCPILLLSKLIKLLWLKSKQQQTKIDFNSSLVDLCNRDNNNSLLANQIGATVVPSTNNNSTNCTTISTQQLIVCNNDNNNHDDDEKYENITNNHNVAKSVQPLSKLLLFANLNMSLSKEEQEQEGKSLRNNPLDTEKNCSSQHLTTYHNISCISINNNNSKVLNLYYINNNSNQISKKNKRKTRQKQIQNPEELYSSSSSSLDSSSIVSSHNNRNLKNSTRVTRKISYSPSSITNVNRTGLIIDAIDAVAAHSAEAASAATAVSSVASSPVITMTVASSSSGSSSRIHTNNNFTIPLEHLSAVVPSLYPNGSNYNFDCLNSTAAIAAADSVSNSNSSGSKTDNAATDAVIIINCTLIALESKQKHHNNNDNNNKHNNNNNDDDNDTKSLSFNKLNIISSSNSTTIEIKQNNSKLNDNVQRDNSTMISAASILTTDFSPKSLNGDRLYTKSNSSKTRDVKGPSHKKSYFDQNDITSYQREEPPRAVIYSQADQPILQTQQQQPIVSDSNRYSTNNNQQQLHQYYYSGSLRDNDPSVLLSRYPSLRLPPPPPEFADEFNEGMTEINTVSGGRVEIPCNTSSWIEDEVSLVLWFRGDTGVPIYRVDARSVPLIKSVHTTADELRKRFHFDINAKPPVLQINPVLPSDAAEYRCRVDFRQSRTQNVLIALNVTVPPKEVLIMDIEGQKLEGVIGPYDENSNVLLICEAEGGKPSPDVNWYQGSRLIDSSFTTGPHGLVRNELNIRNINRTDFMSILTCRASNNNVTEPVSATVILDMNLRPLDVKILTNTKMPSLSPSSSMMSKSGSSVKVSATAAPGTWILAAGSKAEFQCQTIGSRPAAQISWWLGTERLSSNVRDSVNEDGNATISTITFVPGIEDNGKMLTCRADNLPMPHTALKDERLLTVHFAPQLRLSYGANIGRDSIREGSDVYLECRVRANPPVKEVVWLHDGRALHSSLAGGGLGTHLGRRNGPGGEQEDAALSGSDSDPETEAEQRALSAAGSSIIMTNQSLVIQKVYRTHRGRYQCVAFNEQGETVSEPLYLKVNFAPVCRKGQKRQYGVSRNEQIRIRCEVDAEPTTGLTFHWTLNTSGSETSVEWAQFTVNATTSIATYRPESSLDYGLLACVAQNSIGRQSEPCIYNVVPAGRPDPVRSCAITNHSMSTLLVECVPGDDGGLRQHFNLEVYIATNQQLHSNHSSSQPNFIISSLTPGTKYTLILYATNAKGRSHSVSLSAITLLPPEKHIARGSIEQIVVHPILGILIGIVAAIVIIIVVIILIIRHRTGICYHHHHHLQHSSSIRHSLTRNGNGSAGGGGGGGCEAGNGGEDAATTTTSTTTTTALSTKLNGGIKVANCNGKQSKLNGNNKSKKDKTSTDHDSSSLGQAKNSSLLMTRKKSTSSTNANGDMLLAAGAIGMRQLESIVNSNNNNNNSNNSSDTGAQNTLDASDNGVGGGGSSGVNCKINTSLDVIRHHHPESGPDAIDMTIQNNSNEILLNATERTLIGSSPGTGPDSGAGGAYSDMIGRTGSLYDNSGGLILGNLGQNRISRGSSPSHYEPQFQSQQQSYLRSLPTGQQGPRHILDLSSCSSSSPTSSSPSQQQQQSQQPPQSGILLLTDAELAAAAALSGSPSHHLNSSCSSTLTRRGGSGQHQMSPHLNPSSGQQYSLHPYHPYLSLNCTLPRHSTTTGGTATGQYQQSPHSNNNNNNSSTGSMQFSHNPLMHPMYGNDSSSTGYSPVTIMDNLDSAAYLGPNSQAHPNHLHPHHSHSHSHSHHQQQQQPHHLGPSPPILYYNATNPAGTSNSSGVGGSPIQQLIHNHRCSVGPLEPLSAASAEAQDAIYVSVISSANNHNHSGGSVPNTAAAASASASNASYHSHSHSHSDNETMPLLTGNIVPNCNDSETGSDSTGTTATTTTGSGSGSDQSSNGNNQSQHTRPYEIFLPSNVRNNGNATAV